MLEKDTNLLRKLLSWLSLCSGIANKNYLFANLFSRNSVGIRNKAISSSAAAAA
jgi:hypothetical protein